jgi:hypothetical protein
MSHLIAKKWGVVMLFLENGSRYKIMFIKLFSIVRGRFDIPQKYRHIELGMHGRYLQKIDFSEIV